MANPTERENDSVTDDFKTRRASALVRLEKEKRNRGAALLDNRPFDASEVSVIEDEIAALDEAAAEAILRAREVATAEHNERLRDLGKALSEMEEKRLKAVGMAEKAARNLAASLNEILDAATSMRRTIRLMETPVPLALAEGALIDRLSQRLAATMGGIAGHPARFGQVAWRPSWRTASDDWVVSERNEAADDLLPLTEISALL